MSTVKPIIELDDDQQALAEQIAAARLALNDYRGLKNNNIGHRSALELARDGVGGELAHELMTGIKADLTIYDPAHHRLDFRGYDTVVNGWRIDVKCLTGPDLLVPEWQLLKHDDCDGYGFFLVRWPIYTFQGYVHRLVLHQEGTIDENYLAAPRLLKDTIHHKGRHA